MLYINVTHEVMDLDPNAMFQGRKCISNYLNSTKYILYYVYDMYRILKHHFCYSKFRMISLYEAKMNIEFNTLYYEGRRVEMHPKEGEKKYF